MTIRRIASAVVAVALLFAAACGDDDDGSSADEAVAEAAVAAVEDHLRDEGFTAEDDDDDDDGSDLEFVSEECREFEEIIEDSELPNETATADADSFERGEFGPDSAQELVQATIGVAESAADVAQVLDRFADDRLGECFLEAIQQLMQGDDEAAELGIELRNLDVERYDPGVGDENVGVRLGADIGVMDVTFPMRFDLEFVQVGRGAFMLMAGAIGSGEVLVDREPIRQLLIAELERLD